MTSRRSDTTGVPRRAATPRACAPGLPALRVANRHALPKGAPLAPATIYVGRGTPLGNPFEIGTHGDRPTVIAKYRVWLHRQLAVGHEPVVRELDRLATLATEQPLILLCSCAPAACHADVIVRAIYWWLGRPVPAAAPPTPDAQLSLLP